VAKIEGEGIKFYAAKKEITLYPVIIALSDPDLTRRIINFKIDQTIEDIFLLPQRGGVLRFLKTPANQTIQLVLEINKEEISKVLKSNFKELEKSPEMHPSNTKLEGGKSLTKKMDWGLITKKQMKN